MASEILYFILVEGKLKTVNERQKNKKDGKMQMDKTLLSFHLKTQTETVTEV